MGHSITALLLKGTLNEQAITDWDLVTQALPHDLTLAFIDHYYTACWQKMKQLDGDLPHSEKSPILFPREIVLAHIARDLTGEPEPTFGIIYTDYFGGVGEQFAQLYKGTALVDPAITRINHALSALGVTVKDAYDAFEQVGLHKIRSNPDALEKYYDLADELGV